MFSLFIVPGLQELRLDKLKWLTDDTLIRENFPPAHHLR